MNLIAQIRSERAMSVVVATHDVAVALRADRVVALTDGKVVADVYVRNGDSPESLMARISEAP